MSFKGLSVSVSGDAGSAVASLQALKSQLTGTERSANSAGDSVEELGDSANSASASLTALSGSATTAAGSVGLLGRRSQRGAAGFGLMASKASALAVGLGAVSAAAVPLTATLGALGVAAGGIATGFAAVIGTGYLTHQKEVNEALSESTSNIKELLQPLGEQFGPLLVDGAEALDDFAANVINALGPLDPFADALRDAGQASMTFIPALVEQMMDLGRDALPAVRRLGGFIADNLVPAFNAMERTSDRVISLLPDLGASATNALPKINQFGLSILETAIPALRDAGGAITDLIGRFNALDQRTQKLSLGAAFSAPAIAGVVAKLSLINPALGAAAGGVAAFGAAYATNFGNIRELTDDAIDGLGELADEAEPAFEAAQDGAANAADVLETNFAPAVDEGRDALGQLRSGNFEAAFGELTNAASESADAIRQTLVGSGGSGGIVGILDTSLTDAQTFLQGPGGEKLATGASDAVGAAADAFGSLKNVLIGANGESGVLSVMVDQGTTFVSQTAPQLFGDATRAIGSGIRQGLIDMTNPLRGEDSEIFGMLADGAKFLVQNGPDLFISVGQGIVKGILNGFQGLVQGLVGAEEGEITQAFKSAVSNVDLGMFLNLGGDIVSKIGDGLSAAIDFGTTLIDAIELPTLEEVKEGITGIGSTIASAVEELFSSAFDIASTIASAIADALGNLGSMIKNAVTDTINDGIGALNEAAPTVKVELPAEDKGLPGPLPSVDEGDIVDTTIIGDDPFPKLRTGGLVEEAGLAEIHEGEQVVPAAEVDRDAPTSGPEIVVEKVVADSRRGGRQAAKGLKEEMRRFDVS